MGFWFWYLIFVFLGFDSLEHLWKLVTFAMYKVVSAREYNTVEKWLGGGINIYNERMFVFVNFFLSLLCSVIIYMYVRFEFWNVLYHVLERDENGPLG